MPKAKAYGRNFKAQFVPLKEDKTLNTYKYGIDDRLPNFLLQWIMNSGIATRAANKLKQYIYGAGFNEPNTICDNQTLDKISTALSRFNGFSVLVQPLPSGGRKVQYIDFQCVRKATDGSFKFNATIGQPKLDKDAWVTYPAYKAGQPLPVNGALLYAFVDDNSHPHYPIPDYYAGIEDIRTSAELQKLDLEAVYNGFLPGAILTMVGKLDDQNRDGWGRTEQDYFDESIMRFTGQIKDQNGLSERMKLLTINVNSKDEAPILQTFDAKAIIEASNTKRDVIGREVCRLFGVHPVLCGYADAAILGNTQSIANASKELNNTAKQYQILIEDALKKVDANTNFSIKQITPFNAIEPSMLQYLTESEIREKYLGLPPVDRPVPSDGERILSILNGLSPLLATKVIDMIPKDVLLSALGIQTTEQQTELAAFFESETYGAKVTPEEIAQRYADYYETVNMTFSELQRWSETECSRKAGLNRAPIMRNLELLNINKPDWTEKHYRWAGQTIAFVNRMKNGEQGEDVADCGMSKRDISLKNWAYDVDK